jgi:hypothetical protein
MLSTARLVKQVEMSRLRLRRLVCMPKPTSSTQPAGVSRSVLQYLSKIIFRKAVCLKRFRRSKQLGYAYGPVPIALNGLWLSTAANLRLSAGGADAAK